MLTLAFRSGTLELSGAVKATELPAPLTWDARSGVFRAPALAYAEVVLGLRRLELPYEDRARAYPELASGLLARREPRPFQTEGLAAWEKARGRGVVVLPTGAGKSHVAVLAIDAKRRGALVVAPTLDLVRQWYDLLRRSFGGEIGVVGGGSHDVRPLTVTTYDSACLHMEHLGARFGLIVFDECHHLPGPSYALAAELCLAPYRLGLTATPERADGQDERLSALVGPIVYRKDIVELSGRYLADYEVERIDVELTLEERHEYDAERAIYLEFVRGQGIRFDSPAGFGQFVMRSAQSAAGQRAMR
ncbi:MAG TPA: DEAD/DEAH box helicase family protein, partial [Polyangiaceae bacterium]|nr:DEAD/DEAH box helicase family protein [Polyangiaceae bacterium]